MNLLADRFEALIEFFEGLRLKGYNISPIQYMAVQNLLIALASEGRLPNDPKKLSTLIAPVVCSSSEEQEEFYAQFNDWVDGLEHEEAEGGPKRLGPSQADAAEVKDRPRETLFERVKPFALIVIASLILTPIIVKVFTTKTRPNDNLNNSQVNDNEQSNSNPDNSNIIVPPDINRRTGEDARLEPSIVPVELTSDAPVFAPPEAPTESLWSRMHDYVRWGAAALPFLLLGAWWLFQRVQQWRLKRRFSRTIPTLEELKVKGVSERLFRQPELRRAAQQLRRHRAVGVRDLAVHASVEATAQKAGWFTPVYKPRVAIPEYLVLIDRMGFTDQKARLEDELIDRLIENDIHVSRYYFEGDPRLCRAGAGASYLRLQDLEAKHPNDYVLVFSDGAGMMNPLTGRVQRWVELFSPWPGRALMTTEPVDNWGYRERALADQGFAVLPASSEGITALVRTIQTGNTPAAGREGSPQLYPEILNDRPDRWFADREPDQEDVDVLRIELQYFLGMEGYYWLCACALYPALQWHLTLYFGYRLTGPDEIEARMRNLVRLPWFRQGAWPDWLRARLIADLPEERASAARKALEELLLTALERPEDFSLSVAQSPTGQGEGRLRRWLRSWYKKVALRSLIKETAPDSPLRDYVFLSFLSGNKPDSLAVSVPRALRGLLFKSGQSVLGLRPAAALVLAFVVSLIIWNIIPEPSPPPPPPPQPVLPKFNARPSSGVQGSEVKMMITNWVEDADCTIQSLKDASLVAADGSGLTIRVTSSDDCQMEADISVAPDAPVGPKPLTILRGREMLGAFSFSVDEQGIKPIENPELVAEPAFGRAGSRVIMTVLNKAAVNNAPNSDCERRSLRDAQVVPPPRSGLTLGRSRSDDCRLTVEIDIEPDAPARQLSLAIMDADGEIGKVPFRIVSDQSRLPSRVGFNPAAIIAGSRNRFRLTNPDCRRFSLRGASLPASVGGLVLSNVKVTDCQIEGNIDASGASAGEVTLVLKRQGEEVPIQLTILSGLTGREEDCPELEITCDDNVSPADVLPTIQARVSGIRDEKSETLPFRFFIDGEERYGDAQNPSTLFLPSEYLESKAGRTLDVRVKVTLERRERKSCDLSATCKIRVLPNAEAILPQSDIDIRKISSNEDEVTFKDKGCRISRISLTTIPKSGEVTGKIYFRDKDVTDLTNREIIARLYKKDITCEEVVRAMSPARR
ncbi:MAG TPA: hypothetical protein VKA70_08260 [Blastocatellia bacterium]|nr:hypothetical protein [Blastocatellia bacterium]